MSDELITTVVVVDQLTYKNVTTKFGERKIWYIVDANEGEQYNVGFKKPAVDVGDEVTIEWELKFSERQATKASQASLVGSGSEPKAPSSTGRAAKAVPALKPAAPSPSSGGKYQPKPFPLPKLHGDRSIIRQNALTSARSLVQSMIEAGVVEFPSPEELGVVCPPEEAVDEITELCIRIAYQFEKYTAGDIESDALAAMEAGSEKGE